MGDEIHYAADGSSDQLHASCGVPEGDDTNISIRLEYTTCIECLQSVIRDGKDATARLAVIKKPAERRVCECHARMAGECACGAWDEPMSSINPLLIADALPRLVALINEQQADAAGRGNIGAADAWREAQEAMRGVLISIIRAQQASVSK